MKNVYAARGGPYHAGGLLVSEYVVGGGGWR